MLLELSVDAASDSVAEVGVEAVDAMLDSSLVSVVSAVDGILVTVEGASEDKVELAPVEV